MRSTCYTFLPTQVTSARAKGQRPKAKANGKVQTGTLGSALGWVWDCVPELVDSLAEPAALLPKKA